MQQKPGCEVGTAAHAADHQKICVTLEKGPAWHSMRATAWAHAAGTAATCGADRVPTLISAPSSEFSSAGKADGARVAATAEPLGPRQRPGRATAHIPLSECGQARAGAPRQRRSCAELARATRELTRASWGLDKPRAAQRALAEVRSASMDAGARALKCRAAPPLPPLPLPLPRHCCRYPQALAVAGAPCLESSAGWNVANILSSS